VFRTEAAKLPIERVLDVGAFDLDRALAVDKGFLEPEYPFEWAGVFEFGAGKVRVRTGAEGAHEHHHHDHGHGEHHAHGHGEHHSGEHAAGHEQAPAHGEGHLAHGHLYHSGLNITFFRVPAASADELSKQIEPAL